MPELPEVEVVRCGLQRWACGRTIAGVEVLHPRAIRRHTAGAEDFADQLIGQSFDPARRRGKYLWLPLADTGAAVLAHLGMSGQLLIQPRSVPDEKHLRVRISFSDPAPPPAGETELRFVDQRTFGGLSLHPVSPDSSDGLPDVIAHIARDPLDPAFDDAVFHSALRARRTTVKRALLDQSLISGVGNIYADEALWRARLHYERPTATLTPARSTELLTHVRSVLTEALAAGGTSFDSLYVNVNGESGYFERSLDAYGREDEPCRRCGTAMRRRPWMNRSSFYCPRCQRPFRSRSSASTTARPVRSGLPRP
ncbi:bifunctional DNA-formamidopyrimidine glycosylase/DNA-(apurinic or apyrimidinic site) lyase [Streptomyces sp. N2-109]|uniref:Formamidopyrimidine-DNA glycosylase n=1 Tax=Streptomyces gossypii TaxID=2883101 RepID=A0ABT2K2B1_9ACTN|nr:bifunctional DNA-formamidopyrimidine glycosylase/DNA-(apurinic or apyrimidinic site) lyase [Streptomyces gossypii]MCT2594293.1 bifunctional DNA-formamidopyrimidine glycosylase/DNA-(apurinic or apyrimidinic site) lyase [Streptomyces gossypii]